MIKCIDFGGKYQKENETAEISGKQAGVLITGVKTPRGWKTADSPYDPEREAAAAAEAAGGTARCALVLGAGSGFVARELYSRGVSSMLVITGSKALARKNAEALNSCRSDSSSDITLINATLPSEELFAQVRSFAGRCCSCMLVEHRREWEIFPGLFYPLSVFAVSILSPQAKANTTEIPKKILFPCSGHLFEPDVKQAFEMTGCEVIAESAYHHSTMNPRKAWELIGMVKPDMVFSINNRGSDKCGFIPEACLNMGIPWCTWFLDEPLFLVQEESIRPEQRRFGFCWDHAGLESCRSLGFYHTGALPLATNPDHFSPGEGIRELRDRIVYVGSPSFGNEEKYFAALMNDPAAQRIAEAVKDQIIAKRRMPEPDHIDYLIRDAGGRQDRFPEQVKKRLPAFCLFRANRGYRIQALSALAPLSPVVFGDGWEGLLPDEIEIRGYVDYYRELPRIYRSDAVHLSLTHLQMRSYPNQRVFDAGACGSAVITDYLCGWQSLFGSGFKDLIFHSIDELYDRAAHLQSSPSVRNQLAEALKDEVILNHTIGHRINSIFEVMTNDISSRKQRIPVPA